MKKYEVTILLMVNPFRDIDEEAPETKPVTIEVEANDEDEAIEKAKSQEKSNLSVWESYATEII